MATCQGWGLSRINVRALSVAAVTNHPKLHGKNPVSAGLGPSGGTGGERFLTASRFQELLAFPGLRSPPQVTLLPGSDPTSPRALILFPPLYEDPCDYTGPTRIIQTPLNL